MRLDSRWELAKDSKLGVFQLRAYKPMYLLPAFWTSKVNDTPSSPNPDNTVTTPQVLDSVAIGQQWQDDVRVVLFVRLQDDDGDNCPSCWRCAVSLHESLSFQ